MDPIELPYGDLPPPLLPPSSEITWLPRRRRHTPRHQRQPWQDPRIATIIQRASPTLVQQSGVRSISSGTTDSWSGTFTAGDCIVVAVSTALNGASAVQGTASDPDNQYFSPTNAHNTNTGGATVQWWAANNCVGGTYAISMTLGTAVKANWEVYEWSGVGSIAGNRSISDATSAVITSGTSATFGLTPQQSGSLALMMISDGGTATTWTKDASSTSLSQTTTNIDFATAYRVLSTTSVATVSPSFSQTGSAVQFAAIGIILRPAGTQATIKLSDGQTGAGTTQQLTFTPKAGELVVLSVQALSASTPSITDASTTWTKSLETSNGGGNNLSVWWAFCSGAIISPIANFSGTTLGSAMSAIAFPGVLPSSNPIDVAFAGSGGGSAVTAVSVGPSSSTVIGKETAILVVGHGGTSTFTPGGSASLVHDLSGANASLHTECIQLSSVGAQTMTATLGSAKNYCAILITIKTGGVSLVQSQTNAFASGATGANVGGAFTFNTAPGNLMLAAIGNGNGKSITGITDNQSVAWSVVPNAPSNGNTRVVQFYRQNIAGGTLNTFNVTFAGGGTTAARFIAVELSGMATSSAYDVQATFTGTSASPSATTPTPNSLLEIGFAAITDGTTGTAFTPTSPAVSPQASVTTTMDLGIGLLASFQPGVVPSGISMGFTNTSAAVAAAVATFKIAGSGAYWPLSAAGSSASATVFVSSLAHVLTATAPGQSSALSIATLKHVLLSTSNAIGAATGTVLLRHILSSLSSSSSTVTNALQLSHVLTATAPGQSALSAIATLKHVLASATSAVSAVAGGAALQHVLSSLVTATSTAATVLQLDHVLSAAVNGLSMNSPATMTRIMQDILRGVVAGMSALAAAVSMRFKPKAVGSVVTAQEDVHAAISIAEE